MIRAVHKATMSVAVEAKIITIITIIVIAPARLIHMKDAAEIICTGLIPAETSRIWPSIVRTAAIITHVKTIIIPEA